MSEYFFDYKVVNMGGNSKYGLGPDKALEFYMYQNPAADKAMEIQVFIPEEMRDKYDRVNIYKTVDGIELADGTPKTVYMNESENSVKNNGCLFIEGDDGELSCVGKLEFIRKDETAARPEDTFEFYVNFIKKDVISYRITEKKNTLEIDLVYPLIRKEIILNVVKKSGAKPLLMCDMDAKLKDKSGHTVRIKLEPRNHNDNAVKVEVDSKDNDKMDAKVVFEDPSLNSYYLLSDISMNTLEDVKERKDTDTLRKNERKICCPFCHKPLVKSDIKARKKETYVFDCQGALLYTDNRDLSGSNILKCTSVSDGFKGKATVVCRSCEITSFDIGGGYPILPDGYGSKDLPVINIATVGFPGSGKSCYLASIYGITQKGPETAAQANSPVLNVISEVFSRSDSDVKRLKANLAKVVGSELKIDYSWENFRIGVNDRNVYSRYAMNVNGKFESQTKADRDEIMALYENPLGFRVGDLGFVYFYDIPGEPFKLDSSVDKLPMLDIADALIAVIDGDPHTGSGAGAYQTVSDALLHLNTTLSCVIHKSELDEDKMKKMPIATVLTKCDKRFIENDKAKDPDVYRRIADSCFDPNCHICIANTAEIVKGAESTKKYKGSAVREHIENTSYEIEHFYKAADDDGRNSFNNIKKEYLNLKFFAVSALGTANAFKAEDDKMKVRFKPRALRTELPVLWLMYQTGLIRE